MVALSWSIDSYPRAAVPSLFEVAVIRVLEAVPTLLAPELTLLVAAPLDCQPDAVAAGSAGVSCPDSTVQRCASSCRLTGVTRRAGEVMGKLY